VEANTRLYLCAQHFADILAAEADERDVAAELVDLSDCEPEDDLITTVVNVFNHPVCFLHQTTKNILS